MPKPMKSKVHVYLKGLGILGTGFTIWIAGENAWFSVVVGIVPLK